MSRQKKVRLRRISVSKNLEATQKVAQSLASQLKEANARLEHGTKEWEKFQKEWEQRDAWKKEIAELTAYRDSLSATNRNLARERDKFKKSTADARDVSWKNGIETANLTEELGKRNGDLQRVRAWALACLSSLRVTSGTEENFTVFDLINRISATVNAEWERIRNENAALKKAPKTDNAVFERVLKEQEFKIEYLKTLNEAYLAKITQLVTGQGVAAEANKKENTK
jgi:hypothetical protein